MPEEPDLSADEVTDLEAMWDEMDDYEDEAQSDEVAR